MTHTVSLCPLCHEHPYPLPKLPYYAYCSDCKLAWLWRFPKAIYGDNYYTGASNVASRLFTPIATLLYRLRSAYVGLGKKKLWIDVGAGDGQFLKTVNAHQKVGVEISPSGRVLMKQAGLKTMTDKQFLRLKNLDFRSDPADSIIAATSLAYQVPLLTRDRVILKSKVVPFAKV